MGVRKVVTAKWEGMQGGVGDIGGKFSVRNINNDSGDDKLPTKIP